MSVMSPARHNPLNPDEKISPGARDVSPMIPPVNVDAVRRASGESSIQVSSDHYLGDYLNLPRMITYWYQAKAVRDCGGRSVLEIGLGMGLTTWILKRWGMQVQTVDLDPELGPTVVGDLQKMPLADDSVDTILIAEVLEHLPFEQFDLRWVALATGRTTTCDHHAPVPDDRFSSWDQSAAFGTGISCAGMAAMVAPAFRRAALLGTRPPRLSKAPYPQAHSRGEV